MRMSVRISLSRWSLDLSYPDLDAQTIVMRFHSLARKEGGSHSLGAGCKPPLPNLNLRLSPNHHHSPYWFSQVPGQHREHPCCGSMCLIWPHDGYALAQTAFGSDLD
ncbi:hypothetical protein FA13DRAFT_1305629 [Coprinellus micaceus]|uniref:Uncharacterized protein n=1 Tax=Coprinellus micaceus TaxID=71717 RepID=A0A4Y7SRT1_COPMI|nr:hypothetical protein FA13DRAFT_1305629 [Coprinellus micaceus]